MDGGMMEKIELNQEMYLQDLETLVEYFHSNLTAEAREYLYARGIKEETIERYRIGYEAVTKVGFKSGESKLGSFFNRRIIFPVRNSEGKVVDFIGRSIDDEPPKYKSLMHRIDVLFNETLIKEAKVICLCGSIIDALTLSQIGIAGVALLGFGTPEEMAWLKGLQGKQVFICFGNDDAGRRLRESVAAMLSSFTQEIYIVQLPGGLKDINDLFLKAENPVQVLQILFSQAVQKGFYTGFSADARNLVNFYQEFLKRRNKEKQGIPTGIEPLDEKLFGGLREGLYVIGGVSSVGKTTLLKQIADSIAGGGIPVLFISYEMSAFELWAKSLGRIAGIPVSTILNGKAATEIIKKANEEFAEVAQNIWTVEGDINTSPENISTYMKRTVYATGHPPVVFIDSLQRVPVQVQTPLDYAAKNSLVLLLMKMMAREFGCPVVVSFSLGRSAYEDDDPFKEIDEIKWMADVVMILKSLWDPYDFERQDECPAQLDIQKNRHGLVGTIELMFYKNKNAFAVETTTKE